MQITYKLIQFIFYTLVLYLCSLSVYAFPSQNSQSELQHALLKANNIQLYKKPTWLRLLHFDAQWKQGQASEILSPLFFLSHSQSTATIHPKTELQASLRAMFKPANSATNGNQNLHAQCRFPARFSWLKQQLQLDLQWLPKVNCDRLEKWAKFSSLDSISLILVGGYFGNPASTFGHLLVKLNNSEYKSSSGNLLDQTVNYGAQVPDNEAVPVYIFKGLFGGYVSRFRDKAFYKQDRVYSREELRDMWEYELNLTSEQQQFLVYHLWEVMGMESTYYFLKKNCAYRIAALLELVTDKTLKPNYQPWYLPISTFQKLTDIEQSHYIKKITFLPSNQRKLYHQFDQLQADEAQLVNKLLASNKPLKKSLFKTISVIRQAKMIEVMLAYYQYQLTDTAQDITVINTLKQRKNHLLLLRLQLPITDPKQKTAPILEIPSPASGSKPRLFSVGLGQNKTSHFLELGLTAIHYDVLTQSYGMLENSELKVFDLGLKYTKQQKLSLNYFNLLSIQKLNLSSSKLHQTNDLSWRIAVGIKARDNKCDDCNGFYLSTGMGKAWQISPNILSYAMLDGRYHANGDDFFITPNIGLILKYSHNLKSVLEMGIIANTKKGEKTQKIKWETDYALSKNNSVRFLYEKQGDKFSLSYYHHW